MDGLNPPLPPDLARVMATIKKRITDLNKRIKKFSGSLSLTESTGAVKGQEKVCFHKPSDYVVCTSLLSQVVVNHTCPPSKQIDREMKRKLEATALVDKIKMDYKHAYELPVDSTINQVIEDTICRLNHVKDLLEAVGNQGIPIEDISLTGHTDSSDDSSSGSSTPTSSSSVFTAMLDAPDAEQHVLMPDEAPHGDNSLTGHTDSLAGSSSYAYTSPTSESSKPSNMSTRENSESESEDEDERKKKMKILEEQLKKMTEKRQKLTEQISKLAQEGGKKKKRRTRSTSKKEKEESSKSDIKKEKEDIVDGTSASLMAGPSNASIMGMCCVRSGRLLSGVNSEMCGHVKRIQRLKRLFALSLFGITLSTALLVKRSKSKEWHQLMAKTKRLQGQRFGELELYDMNGVAIAEPVLKSWLAIQSFSFRADDLLVTAFPKSGITWLQEIVWLIANHLDFRTAKLKLITDRFPYLEFPTPGLKSIERLKSPRFIKTHFMPTLLFSDTHVDTSDCIHCQKTIPKMITILRNPKDLIVSYYHFCRMNQMIGFKEDFDHFFDRFIKGSLPYGPFWSHYIDVLDWNDSHSDDNQILVIYYEDLKRDFVTQVNRICDFMGKPEPSVEDMKALQIHCSFDQMKDNPSVNYKHWDDFGFRDRNESQFMRRGEIGDWKCFLSPQQNAIIEKQINDKLQNRIKPSSDKVLAIELFSEDMAFPLPSYVLSVEQLIHQIRDRLEERLPTLSVE
ncbi:unnamed protein product [Medioppia subpectinata]|uniref:Sulfotransferase domain-containing protein n=1 Tax=Medioppia subpectinata TaxID=1979941 RepID=A0A7R9Q285_9ACAR|nr:unnamed protein product [Medioppia subpectinata]CAG2109237.1 unnamed protein product [Medioppia subpectinata]